MTELSDDFDNDEERYLHETLKMIDESYAKIRKPYIDRLVKIRCCRMPSPMFMTIQAAVEFGFIPPSEVKP